VTTFAKGLVSGTIKTPARMSWWPRHVRALMEILAATGTKPVGGAPGAWGELEAVAKEWETLCPKPAQHGLMLEHSLLEIALIDSVRKNSAQEVDRIGEQLFENATELSAVLGISIVQFPEEHFKKLFSDHVALYAGSVRKKIEGVRVTSGEMESNTLALADLTAEWL
jgi:hypothetical protein